MKLKKLNESGYEEALLGISLSYNSTLERAEEISGVLSCKEGGHNKFLESMVVWLDIVAPRYFWQQFDTYRVGITKQSESTMHTILKTRLTKKHFAGDVPYGTISELNFYIANGDLERVKQNLPEAFLQRRIVMVSYKTLRNIYHQRKEHRLTEWKDFCSWLENNLSYPDFVSGERK